MWFRKPKESLMEGNAELQADGDPGTQTTEEVADPVDSEVPFEPSPPTTANEESHGRVPTRESLIKELREARTQVIKLEQILALDDETIHLFLGTERYL